MRAELLVTFLSIEPLSFMNDGDKLEDYEVQKIIYLLRNLSGPNRVVISESKLGHPCYRCKKSMCSVDEPDKNTYYLCFRCGQKTGNDLNFKPS